MQTQLSQSSRKAATGQLSSRQRTCFSKLATSQTSRSSGINRSRSVQVEAKGKGKTSFRTTGGIPGQMQMQTVEPPVPEVDPVNVEFVIFARVKNAAQMVVPSLTGPKAPVGWLPLSVVKGSQAANFLVKAMEVEWGRQLYAKTLVDQVANACYKDRAQIEKMIRGQFEAFKTVPSRDFEYGFKIRDKSAPKDWYKAVDITVFPSEEELKKQGTAMDSVKRFFGMQ